MPGRATAPRTGTASEWAARAWTALEDRLYPMLRCSPVERTLYNHLLRHTLLAGRCAVRRTKADLSRATGICGTAVRDNLRALEAKGCVRIRERAKCGLLIEVRWPGNFATETQRTQKRERKRLNSIGKMQERETKYEPRLQHETPQCEAPRYEALARQRVARNPFKSLRFRSAMRRREGGRCFYCRQRLSAGRWGLDHIISRARGGGHTASNAAACCVDCNREKGERPAAEFLQWLYRQGRINREQLRAQLDEAKHREAQEGIVGRSCKAQGRSRASVLLSVFSAGP